MEGREQQGRDYSRIESLDRIMAFTILTAWLYTIAGFFFVEDYDGVTGYMSAGFANFLD